jgi:chromosome condensin MukBEF complex kleisin-like MukF subunit
MVVAKGISTPIKPYFFLQEYKRFQLGSKSDPLSQLLGEMLVANSINKTSKSFGCYIVGRFWYFVILENKNYTVSEPFDSINIDDLRTICLKLQAVKEYIENILLEEI